MSNVIDRQVAEGLDDATIPSRKALEKWLKPLFEYHDINNQELTVRFVAETESAELNCTYRGKDYATNVLSFPFESPPGVTMSFLGDLVICAPVIKHESQLQSKQLNHHYAHMVIHGCLHLLGYDHIEANEADKMEKLEITLLHQLGIDDPYQEI